MEKVRLFALLNEVLEEKNEGVLIEIIDDVTVEVDGAEYKVFTDKEADEEFNYYQEDLINDVGINGFSEWGQEYILEHFTNKDWFYQWLNDYYEQYLEDLRDEEADNKEKFNNAFEEELNRWDCYSEGEYISARIDADGDVVAYYIDNIGLDSFKEVVRENDLIDWEKVIDWVKKENGRGCLAVYDNEELELENGYYAYRVN